MEKTRKNKHLFVKTIKRFRLFHIIRHRMRMTFSFMYAIFLVFKTIITKGEL